MSLNVEVKIDVILHATESQEKIFDSFKENFCLLYTSDAADE